MNGLNGKRLLTVNEAARFLGISARTIYNGVGRKAKKPFPIAPIRIGSSIRFDLEDLTQFIELQKQNEER